MLDGFKETVRKVCEGPYDNSIRPGMRLLYHTRPTVEKFAKDMITKLPGITHYWMQSRLMKLTGHNSVLCKYILNTEQPYVTMA